MKLVKKILYLEWLNSKLGEDEENYIGKEIS